VRRILLVILIIATAVTLPAAAAHAVDEQFTLTADYAGLFPNAEVSVPVTVRNPHGYELAVHTADVVVGDAGPSCPAANLEASSYAGDVVAPPHGDATIPVRMHMLATAPDACQGATFPLRFTASGEPLGVDPDQPHSGSASTSGFAFTGAESWTMTLVGAGALVVGLALTGVRRRRTSGASS
jgi:LPXTG-motif cell wall-anchored protein